jgi:uncharacterized membrane protein YagU involved in acid resistance
MAILLYGNKPMNAFDSILALIMHLGFSGILGVIYVYIVPLIGTQNQMLKGLIFGLSVFFIAYSITTLLKTNELTITPPYTVASNIITGSIYGLVLAKLYKDKIRIQE